MLPSSALWLQYQYILYECIFMKCPFIPYFWSVLICFLNNWSTSGWVYGKNKIWFWKGLSILIPLWHHIYFWKCSWYFTPDEIQEGPYGRGNHSSPDTRLFYNDRLICLICEFFKKVCLGWIPISCTSISNLWQRYHINLLNIDTWPGRRCGG